MKNLTTGQLRALAERSNEDAKFELAARLMTEKRAATDEAVAKTLLKEVAQSPGKPSLKTGEQPAGSQLSDEFIARLQDISSRNIQSGHFANEPLLTTKTIFLVVMCSFLVAGILYFRSPLRTKIPDNATPLNTIREFQQLNREDLELVFGYLLRQRGESFSIFMRDDATFDARTFADAIEAQKAFLKKQGYQTPSAFLRIGLHDQARRPLRDAVSIEMIERGLTTERKTFNIPEGRSTRHGYEIPEEDKPVPTVTLRIHNRTAKTIDHLDGLVDLRKASYRQSEELGSLSWCDISIHLAPNSYEDVKCNRLQSANFHAKEEFLSTPDGELFMVWEPRLVVFSDGTELRYKEGDADSNLLWGFYRVEK